MVLIVCSSQQDLMVDGMLTVTGIKSGLYIFYLSNWVAGDRNKVGEKKVESH